MSTHEREPLAQRVRSPRRVLRAARMRGKQRVHRAMARGFAAYARARPRADEPERVIILLISAWGMGGTIRAALNMAGYLAEQGREVRILSFIRRRDEPFFGEFPPGVEVIALDDQRPERRPRGLRGLARRVLMRRSSALMHPSDHSAPLTSLWSDVRLVRELRGRRGFLVSTRPGLNLIAADLALPGLTTIGLEQMHFMHHVRWLREAAQRRYQRLDAFVVLTEQDRRNYAFLDGKVHMARITNTVRPLPGAKADLSSRRVLAAGRLTGQKGFDLLIPAWAQVHREHPDWTLRICGYGHARPVLERLIGEHALEGSVELPGAGEMDVEMAEAAIFAMPSRFEGFPLILLEAMSKGMAVIAFDCPTGPADIVDDHRNGLLIPHLDVDAFAAGLKELIADRELRERCAAAAIETSGHYTMDVIGPQWERLLRDLSGCRRRPGDRAVSKA